MINDLPPNQTEIEFFKSVVDAVNPNFDTGPFIAGGYPMRVYMGADLWCHDVDIFCTSPEQVEYIRSLFFIEKNEICINDEDDTFIKNDKISVNIVEDNTTMWKKNNLVAKELVRKNWYMHESNNAYTISSSVDQRKIVQIIKKPVDSIEDLFNNIDATCCRIATDGKDFIASDETYHAIEHKIFDVPNVRNNTIKRMTKYVAYGFTPSQETIQKLHARKDSLEWNFINDSDYQ